MPLHLYWCQFLVHSSLQLFSIFKMAAVRHFGFSYWNLRLILSPRAKYDEDRTIRGRIIAYFRFSNGGRPPSWIRYDVIADHTRLVFDGPNIVLKLHVDRVYTFQDIAIFIIRPVWLKIAYSRPEFLGLLRVRPGQARARKRIHYNQVTNQEKVRKP